MKYLLSLHVYTVIYLNQEIFCQKMKFACNKTKQHRIKVAIVSC